MSPTSYRTAPPRAESCSLPQWALVELPCAAGPGHRSGWSSSWPPPSGRACGDAGWRSPPGRPGRRPPPHRGMRSSISSRRELEELQRASTAEGGAGAAAALDRRVHGAVTRRLTRSAASVSRRPQVLHDQVTVRVAAIDIGTNSTRLLVADADGGLCARSSGCSRSRGWATASTPDGELAEASMQRVETCVARYADRAREPGTLHPAGGGDQRRPRRGQRGRVHAASGAALRGAHPGADRRAGGAADAARRRLGGSLAGAVVVCDIGGGSTELIAGEDGRVDFAASLTWAACG